MIIDNVCEHWDTWLKRCYVCDRTSPCTESGPGVEDESDDAT